MRPYDARKPLISLHIPKCAGTSFKAVLEKWYGKRFHPHYFNERENLMPAKVENISDTSGRKGSLCIHGHFNADRGFGVRDYYPDAEQYITILREPFDIHVSNYFFGKKISGVQFRNGEPLQEFNSDEYSLEQYLAERPRSFMLKHFPFDLNLENYRQVIEDNFIYIGVTEDLQTSVDHLADTLGFRSVKVPTLNRATRQQGIPQQAREQFISNNPLEYAIYNYALSVYDKAPIGTTARRSKRWRKRLWWW